MAFQGDRTGNAKQWFCLNPDAAVASMTAQNKGPRDVEYKPGASGTVGPTDRTGTLTYEPGDGIGNEEALVDRFTGSGAGPFFIWAISEEPVTISVSYG